MDGVRGKRGKAPNLRFFTLRGGESGISADQEESSAASRKKLVVEPLGWPARRINEFVAGLNDSNLHKETESGQPVGKEVW